MFTVRSPYGIATTGTCTRYKTRYRYRVRYHTSTFLMDGQSYIHGYVSTRWNSLWNVAIEREG